MVQPQRLNQLLELLPQGMEAWIVLEEVDHTQDQIQQHLLGTDIKAVASGTVIYASYSGGYGNLIKIDHGNNVETYYAHCNKLYVSVGEEIQEGQIIAAVGSTGLSTGPHLHLEVRLNGNTINPQKYMYK